MRQVKLFTLLICVLFVKGNLWDSIFTNSFSPHYNLYKEGSIEVTVITKKSDTVSLKQKIADIQYSVKLDSINIEIHGPLKTLLPVKTIYINFTNESLQTWNGKECKKLNNLKGYSKILNLNLLLQSYEELSIFDNRDNLKYWYYFLIPDTSTLPSRNIRYLNSDTSSINSISTDFLNSFLGILNLSSLSSENDLSNNKSFTDIVFKKEPKNDNSIGFGADKKLNSLTNMRLKYSIVDFTYDAKYKCEYAENLLKFDLCSRFA